MTHAIRHGMIIPALLWLCCLTGAMAWAQEATPEGEDLESTITLQLNNFNTDQLVKFLSDTTGKPVIKQKDVNTQITVTSPKPVTKRRALELIYDALLIEGVYVIEMNGQLHMVKAESVKNLQLRSLGAEEDVQALDDETGVVQKIYKLENISAENLKKHLDRFVPETAMSIDEGSNTLIVTDEVKRMKRYDKIIRALDQTDEDRVVNFFELEHTDALFLAEMIRQVLDEEAAKSGRSPGGRPPSGGPGGQEASSSFVVEDITIVADPRLNRLIVACPREKLAKVAGLVEEMDQPRPEDVQTRMIDITHIEADSLARRLNELFQADRKVAEKDEIRIVPYEDGRRLLIRSSEENYGRIVEIVEQLDSEDAEKRETRTYQIEHLAARDLADRLEELFEDRQTQQPYWYYWSSSSNEPKTDATFVALPRNNKLMVLAKPRDFQFIEEMIEELDQPVDIESFEPRIYQIRHTDANELVKVMESLFTGDDTEDRGFYYWRGNQDEDDAIKDVFGDLRFVVDNVTNRLVVLASDPKNYQIIENMIEKFDRFDPEASDVLVIELKYADPVEVADRLNSLLSDSVVPMQQPQQRDGEDAEEQAETIRRIIFPWQTEKDDDDDEERPINTMIGNVRIVPDERSNQLIIAAPPMYFAALRNMVEQLDQEEPQISLQARIVEITRGKERRIGLRWTPDPTTIEPDELDNAIQALGSLGFLDATGGGNRTNTIAGVDRDLPSGSDQSFTSDLGDGSTVLGADVDLTLLFQLLDRNTLTKVLAEPRTVVHNNQEGDLFVGALVPFRTQSQTTDEGGLNTSIERNPVGLTLTVTPRINMQDEIVLTVFLENSQIRPGELIDGNFITDQTRLTTSVAVDSGQTMVLGGIIVENMSNSVRKIPILGSIPGVRWLFSKRDRDKQIRELLIFLTPQVLATRADDDALLDEANQRIDRLLEDDKEPEAFKKL